MVIISHEHKFIYIKTYKTASTSIQVLLEKYCGEKDIVTPIEPVTTKKGELYNQRARNYDGYSSHMRAVDIKDKVGNKIWNEYYKFTFERNPWDKAVSFYHFYLIKKEFQKSFEEWISGWIKREKGVSNYDIYTINNKIAVDFIGRYENLTGDLESIFHKLNLTIDELPREKSDYRKGSANYRSYYNNKTRKLIAKRNKREIKLFEYSF
ncbi:MAG: sulfotransferase family 2 domain-containing protein [Promethearchaeota archaeon]